MPYLDDFDDFLNSFDDDKRINEKNKKKAKLKNAVVLHTQKYKIKGRMPAGKPCDAKLIERIGEVDIAITSEFEAPTRMDVTQDLKNAIFHMFDMSTTAYISDPVQLSVYFSYVGGIKNEKFTCKTKKNRMELREQFERAICEYEGRQNLNQLPVTRYRFHASHIKFYNNKTYNEMQTHEILTTPAYLKLLYENDKQKFFTATQEQEKILREAYNLGISAMLENMAKEKGLSYYDDMDKLVAEFNQNTIFLVLQVTENDIHMHRIYKTDSKQLF
jgi:hypothetical protein